jgi:hypothetical protein
MVWRRVELASEIKVGGICGTLKVPMWVSLKDNKLDRNLLRRDKCQSSIAMRRGCNGGGGLYIANTYWES